jgi:hypothetical protein
VDNLLVLIAVFMFAYPPLVGLQWGNDPELTPTIYNDAVKNHLPAVNPYADKLRISLGGTRPYWGFDGRLNGPGKLDN